jgi:hypothetical protein
MSNENMPIFLKTFDFLAWLLPDMFMHFDLENYCFFLDRL